MHAYDLSRLQKPMGPPDAVMAAGKPNEVAPYRDMPPLSGGKHLSSHVHRYSRTLIIRTQWETYNPVG